MNAVATVHNYAVTDLERMALAFSGSKMFGVTTPDQALALCLVAQAEGRHPASAAMDYSIIQNRPAKKADAMLRDFISSGGKVEWHQLDNETADATFSHPSGGSVRIDWTMARAKEAGLGGKDMWKKYPRQMLRSRTVSEGVRTVCPGATSGMYVPEEVQDFAPAATNDTVRDVTDEMDGTPQPRKSAHQARKDGDYERLTGGMREAAKEGEDALKAWAKAEADLIGAQPHGWQAELRKEYGELLAECRARAADPYGLFVEPPEGDDSSDWMAWLEIILASIEGAPDAEQVAAAQTVNAEGLTLCMAGIEGVAERIAEASENRLAALMDKAA